MVLAVTRALGSILILMFAGIPVGIAFLAVCTVTAYHLYGRFGGFDDHLSSAIFQLIEMLQYGELRDCADPDVLVDGELFFHTGLAKRMFNAIEQLLGRVPARLSYVTVGGMEPRWPHCQVRQLAQQPYLEH